ncbi:nucleoside-diphosphate-sugar epimerase [Bradyrhizobium sp. GM5.1]
MGTLWKRASSTARAQVRPCHETALLAPIDDYSVTKAADLALGAMAHRGLKCARLRPFNHTGVGQTGTFVVPAFAMQIAKIEARLTEPIMRVGNLEAERDFLDVRDVATAYASVVRNTQAIESGTILNIASGKAHRVRDLLEMLLALSQLGIKVEQDPARMRPSDLPRIVGNAQRSTAIARLGTEIRNRNNIGGCSGGLPQARRNSAAIDHITGIAEAQI